MKSLVKIFALLVSLIGLGTWSGAALAAPAWQASSAIAASTGVDVTVTLPPHAANDILLLQVVVRDVNDTITWPNGWAQIATVDRGTTARYWWAWKRAASNAEPNPLVNKSGATGDTYAAVTTYRGAITTGDPWEVKGTPNTSTAAGHVLNGITTLTAESLIVASLCGENNSSGAGTNFSATNPTSLTEVLYVESSTGSDGACTTGAAVRTITGDTGPVTATWTSSNGGSGGIVLALKPAPPAVTSINTANTNPTNAASVSWTVTFSTSVTGVSSSNFALVNTGLGGTPAITGVSGGGTTWTVTASTGTGSGTLGLNMTNTTSVSPALTNLPFSGQAYTIRAVVYYHDTAVGVNIGVDGPTNVQSNTNVTIPPIITASLITTNACTGNARSTNHPTGLYTHSRWYLTTNYAGNTDIGANPIGSASLYGNTATDTVIVRLYDYDPVLGGKTLIGSSSAITLTGGQNATAYAYTISSALYTVPAGHRLMLQYDFNQPGAADRARVYCSAADAYIAVTETASPPVNCTSNANGNWSAAGTWTNCRGGIPLAGDAVTILSGHTVTLNTDTPVSLGNLTNGGTLSAPSGIYTLNIGGSFTNTGTTTLGSTTVNLYGDFTNNKGANFNLGSAETGTWNFVGAVLQNINSSGVLTTFPSLTLDNIYGIALNATSTVKNLLTLTNGYISTGTNKIILLANCAVPSWSRTNGFVAGNVRLTFPTGTTTCTYPVGSGTTYAPIGMTMVASAGGTLTGSTTGEEHQQIATSGIDPNGHDVNRYWSLWATGDTVTATSYGATFNFVSGDLDATATTSNFVIGMYASGAWTVPTPITTGITAGPASTGISSVAGPITATTDFVAGEKLFVCSVPGDLPSNMVCYCDNFNRASVNPSSLWGDNSGFSLTSTGTGGTTGWPKIANGHLQMTNNTGNMATSATVPGTFPAKGNLISVEFLHYAYQNTGAARGADGIGVTLSDSSITPLAGAYGGSLGYAQKTVAGGGVTDTNGFAGGWIGIGIDEYGNFSNPTEGRVGGPGERQQSVAVRGSGIRVLPADTWLTGYSFLGGTGALGASAVDNTSSATPAWGYAYRVQVDARCYENNTASYAPPFAVDCASANSSGGKWAKVRVYRDTTGLGNFGSPLSGLDFEAYAAAIAAIPSAIQADVPTTWKLSYTGSTGSSLNYHEIGKLKICAQAITPPAGYLIQVDNTSPSTGALVPPGSCPVPPIVTVTALDTNGNPVTTYNKTVTLSAPLSGGGASSAVWHLKTGAGSFSGGNQYTFGAADLGVVQFYLTDASPQSVTVTVSENGGSISSFLASPPAPIVYSGGSFTIANIDALASNPGGGVVAGRPHKMSVTRSNGCVTDTTYTGVKNLAGWFTPITGDHPVNAVYPDLCATNSSGTCLPMGACQTLAISAPTPPTTNYKLTPTFGTSAPGSPPNGVAYFCLATRDVGKYSISLRDDSAYPATVSGSLSGGALTVRPFAVVASNITGGAITLNNPANGGSSGAIFTQAGTAFRASVGAYLWNSAADSNGDGVPDSGATLSQVTGAGSTPSYWWLTTLSATLNSPSGGTVGAFGGSSVLGTTSNTNPAVGSPSCPTPYFVSGIACPGDLTYGEVGSMNLNVAPDSGFLNTLGLNLTAANGTVLVFDSSGAKNTVVGRFIPHHFGITGSVVTRSDVQTTELQATPFTYMDEPMKLSLVVTAYNKNEGVTNNYAGSWAKLNASALGSADLSKWTCISGPPCMGLSATSGATLLTSRLAIDTTSTNSAVPSNTTWSGGKSTFTLYSTFGRAAGPDGPYDSSPTNILKIGGKPLDTDGVTLPPRWTLYPPDLPTYPTDCVNLDASTGTEDGVYCNPGATETNLRRKLFETKQRFGRIKLSNAFGSEKSTLQIPVQTQYWSGNSWVLNSDDSSTPIPATRIALSNYRPLTFGTTPTGPGTLSAGTGFITLSAPAPSTGSVDLAINLGLTTVDNSCLATHTPMTAPTLNLAYLRGMNGSCTASSTYAADPSATATFGVYAPEIKKTVHVRELY